MENKLMNELLPCPPSEASPPSYVCPPIRGDLDLRGRLQSPPKTMGVMGRIGLMGIMGKSDYDSNIKAMRIRMLKRVRK